MTTQPNHSDENNHKDFLRKAQPPFSRSKEDVWRDLSKFVSDNPSPATAKVMPMYRSKLAIAATLAVVLGASLFFRFYSATVSCPRGEHRVHLLPDGSEVTLNAESSLIYHPYWWRFSREVILNGEAFFKVKKGENFAVISKLGTTEVLGTSFNVLARRKDYRVYCETGKVRVSNATGQVDLLPAMMAVLGHNQWFEISTLQDAHVVKGWTQNDFIFTAQPLSLVFEEIERQLNISIQSSLHNPEKMPFTGYFNKAQGADNILDLICQSFGLSFVKQSPDKYIVSQK